VVGSISSVRAADRVVLEMIDQYIDTVGELAGQLGIGDAPSM